MLPSDDAAKISTLKNKLTANAKETFACLPLMFLMTLPGHYVYVYIYIFLALLFKHDVASIITLCFCPKKTQNRFKNSSASKVFQTQKLSDELRADYYYKLTALQSADSSWQNSLEGSACLLPTDQTQESGSRETLSAAAVLSAESQVLIICYNPILWQTCCCKQTFFFLL